jgi:hypothetical protein
MKAGQPPATDQNAPQCRLGLVGPERPRVAKPSGLKEMEGKIKCKSQTEPDIGGKNEDHLATRKGKVKEQKCPVFNSVIHQGLSHRHSGQIREASSFVLKVQRVFPIRSGNPIISS